MERLSTSNYIYVTGGRFRGKTLGDSERFNLQTLAWEVAPRMLENRGSHGMNAIGTKLIVTSGGGFKSNLSTVEMLDCAGDENIENAEWVAVAPMTTHRHAIASTDFEQYVYVLGGWVDGSTCTGVMERYDADLNLWSTCAPLLFPRRLHGAAALPKQRKIFVFGGNCNDGEWYTSSVESYDVDSDAWARMNDLPYAGPCSAATVSGVIYIFMHGNCVLKYDFDEDKYEKISGLPFPDWYCFSVVAVDSFVYAVGGALKGKWAKCFSRYDTVSNTWEVLPPMRKERRRCAAALMRISRE